MAAKSRQGKTAMSAEHKRALAVGREEGRAVRRYLEALETYKPKRGRRRSGDNIETRLKQIDDRLGNADPLSRVHLVQERINLQAEVTASGASVDIGELEDEFVAAARSYGERKKLTYAAWREAGVDAAVLRRAGISRS
jgi:hypothetical protein